MLMIPTDDLAIRGYGLRFEKSVRPRLAVVSIFQMAPTVVLVHLNVQSTSDC